jgi:hypothetical protein
MYRLGIAVALVAAVVGALVFIKKPGDTNPSTQTVALSLPQAAPEQKRAVLTGAREYRNAEYHFSILHPEGLRINERAEGGRATTITFQNVEKGTGFQIFITPYEGTQVSEDRFKQDIPSGVREKLEAVTIAGASGAAFYSEDAALGATREVWFVKDGLLYEVTTVKQLEKQLAEVLLTWDFI